MQNEYVFDYGLVLKEDPTFEKFIQYEQVGIELEKELAGRRAVAIPEDQADDLAIIRGDTKEEKGIIDFVHDASDKAIDSLEPGPDLNMLNAAVDGHNMYRQSSEALTPQPIVNLKPEYEDPPNPNYDPSIPQLLPPNRFLKEGSKIWMGSDVFYCFHTYPSRDKEQGKSISVIARYHFSRKLPFIRLIHTKYWFDRAKNVMSEHKAGFKSWVYNVETKQMYLIKKERKNTKTKAHFHNRIRKVFNVLLESDWNGNECPSRLINKFLNNITQIVIKDIGEIVIPEPHSPGPGYVGPSSAQRMKLAVTLLQHRVGQPTRWLNYLFISNLWSIMSDVHFYDRVQFGQPRGRNLENLQKRERALNTIRKNSRRNTVGKLIPNLQKNNHMRTAVKSVFGKYYSKFFVKLLNMGEIDKKFLSLWISCTHEGIIDKNLYHWFVQSINNNDIELVKQIILTITPMLYSLLGAHGEDDKTEITLRAKSYIKTCKRLYTRNKLSLPPWYIWNDMCDMAGQLNIRIRPNKLTGAVDVHAVHDKLTSIIRRDRYVINKYKDVIFDEFVSPDKDYDGFHFIQLRTAEALTQEGIVMHHCVGGYASRCARGKSIIFSMRKSGKSYVTIELNPNGDHKIVQQYTLHDITVTGGEALNLINKWHSDCVALHVKDAETYYDRCRKREDKDMQEARNNVLNDLLEGGIFENAAAV